MRSIYNINKSRFCGYNIMGGESTELLKKLVEEFFVLRGIILSDNEGLHICSSFSPH